MNIRQLPDGTIEIDDGSRPDGHIEQESNFTYERSEIDQYFIDECERMADETGETHFLFDTKISHLVKRKNILNKEDRRESDLSELLECEAYHRNRNGLQHDAFKILILRYGNKTQMSIRKVFICIRFYKEFRI